MKQLGLIGFPLTHSFSKKYFSQKFAAEGLENAWHYELFPIESIEKLPELLRGYPNLVGLNVTIPYKEVVMPYVQELDVTAQAVGAVNCIKITHRDGEPHLKGFNTDYYGFQKSLLGLIGDARVERALILGTGGSSKAVAYALNELGIASQYVSRHRKADVLSYDDLSPEIVAQTRLIVNTTPLGMSPNTEGCAPIPYAHLDADHFLYDLVYNPETTRFLHEGLERGAKVKSGLDMLYFQAEKGWEIWNEA